MLYADLTPEQVEETEVTAMNNIATDDWPQPGSTVDVTTTFGTVTIKYSEWQNILCNWNF